MSKINKPDTNYDVRQLVQQAARAVAGSRADRKTTKAELKNWVSKNVPRSQRALVNLVLKFSDFTPDGNVNVKELDRAVEIAKQHLVERYDLSHTALTRSELEQMHLVGKRSTELARALKAGLAPAGPAAPDLD